MSVDPDDVTREGILLAGATDVVYGTPVLPGAMFLSGNIGDRPVLGLPACGMFHKITVLDLILPRILCGRRSAGNNSPNWGMVACAAIVRPVAIRNAISANSW